MLKWKSILKQHNNQVILKKKMQTKKKKKIKFSSFPNERHILVVELHSIILETSLKFINFLDWKKSESNKKFIFLDILNDVKIYK